MTKQKVSIIFSFLFLILFASMAWTSVGYNELAKYFPLFLALIGSLLSLVSLIKDTRTYKNSQKWSEDNQDEQSNQEGHWDIPINHNFKAAASNFLWVVFYFVIIMLIGFVPATVIFLVLFLKIRTDYNWFKVILATGVTVAFLLIMANIMYLKWPTGFFELL